jgi:hypothetical protein
MIKGCKRELGSHVRKRLNLLLKATFDRYELTREHS